MITGENENGALAWAFICARTIIQERIAIAAYGTPSI